jgi:tRNA-splicing ligase RtcB
VGLDVRTAAGAAYVEDVAWALTFARKNRDVMLARAVEVLAEEAGATPLWDERVDVHHNFVAPEVHGGRPLWVHRKGATSAREGELGLIPGSMGTASYVVRGKGASASLASCSHGAGRVYSRGEARRHLDTRGLARAMRQVVYDEARAAALVEEAPAAYRDIREVLEDQEGLVEPVWRLEPRLVLKG